jgi:hypothetical protein
MRFSTFSKLLLQLVVIFFIFATVASGRLPNPSIKVEAHIPIPFQLPHDPIASPTSN